MADHRNLSRLLATVAVLEKTLSSQARPRPHWRSTGRVPQCEIPSAVWLLPPPVTSCISPRLREIILSKVVNEIDKLRQKCLALYAKTIGTIASLEDVGGMPDHRMEAMVCGAFASAYTLNLETLRQSVMGVLANTSRSQTVERGKKGNGFGSVRPLFRFLLRGHSQSLADVLKHANSVLEEAFSVHQTLTSAECTIIAGKAGITYQQVRSRSLSLESCIADIIQVRTWVRPPSTISTPLYIVKHPLITLHPLFERTDLTSFSSSIVLEFPPTFRQKRFDRYDPRFRSPLGSWSSPYCLFLLPPTFISFNSFASANAFSIRTSGIGNGRATGGLLLILKSSNGSPSRSSLINGELSRHYPSERLRRPISLHHRLLQLFRLGRSVVFPVALSMPPFSQSPQQLPSPPSIRFPHQAVSTPLSLINKHPSHPPRLPVILSPSPGPHQAVRHPPSTSLLRPHSMPTSTSISIPR